MNVTIKPKKIDVSSKGWQRDELLRKTCLSAGKVDVYLYSRGIRTDVSLVPPIRQTASIFKQPVTVHRNHDSEVKIDLNENGRTQEKPKQIFWEKRLESINACDSDGSEFGKIDLPHGMKPVGPGITNNTLFHSVTTALHVNGTQPITGQTGSKSSLNASPDAFVNPDQPLMCGIVITDADIKRQEERVASARKNLQNALKY